MLILAVNVLAVNGALHALYSVKKCLIHSIHCPPSAAGSSCAEVEALATVAPLGDAGVIADLARALEEPDAPLRRAAVHGLAQVRAGEQSTMEGGRKSMV